MISNTYCKKHDELEPQDWQFTDGLWCCPKCSRESLKKLNLDAFIEKMQKNTDNSEK